MKLSNQPFLLESATSDHACLLLHGLGGGVYEMQLLGEYLHQQGFTVQGINYPGHDQPGMKMPTSSWRQWYEHILESYQKLSKKYANVSVIGFSTGCPLALYLAAKNPVTNLVLLSPFLALKHEWYYLVRPEAYLFSIGYLIADLPRLQLPILDKTMLKSAQEALFFQTFNLAAVRSAIDLIDRVKPLLPQIDTPTLIIQSLQDRVVDPEGARAIYQQIGSRQKKLYWLKKSDHIISLDVEREDVYAQIKAFLHTK
jgi:carboxylesterase